MAQAWAVQMHHIYREANEFVNGLAKRRNHKQQVLTIYDNCPTSVYSCYVTDMLGLGSNRLCVRQPAIVVDV